MSFQQIAGVQCFVDIYTPENGTLQFTGGDILNLRTSKNINSDTGEFTIALAPSVIGQNLSWGQIITPMSFVVIGMQRGSKSAVTMLGVVTAVIEDQSWQTNNTVIRSIVIRGMDIAYYFQMTDFYTLWYIAATGATSGQGGLAAGLLSGDPGDIGKKWFTDIMAGGVFKGTSLPYKNSAIPFLQFFATQFQNYDVYVPYSDYFLGANGPWSGKFRQIFPFPFYEFFVTTSFGNAFPGASGGTDIQSSGLGSDVTSKAAVIARLNPVPQLVGQADGNAPPTFTSIDTSGWDALETFTLEGASFNNSNISFSESGVYNFYSINPLWMTGQNGSSNSNIRQFLFNFAAVVDLASINRYGYRPLSASTLWFSDPAGQIAPTGKANLQALMATLFARLCGYYEAIPFMARGSVEIYFRPDIEIGTKFEYAPFRDGRVWQFYITGVEQQYSFGGQSRTLLTLDRGLPKDVYQDNSASGLLFNIHIGNAQRVDGDYRIGLPSGSAAPLKAISSQQFATWMAQIDQVYFTQQATAPE